LVGDPNLDCKLSYGFNNPVPADMLKATVVEAAAEAAANPESADARRRLQEAVVAAAAGEEEEFELPVGVKPPNFYSGTEQKMEILDTDIEDDLVGNVWSIMIALILAKVGHTVAVVGITKVQAKSRAKKELLAQEAADKGLPELAMPVPPVFKLPASLDWPKVFRVIMTASYQGICMTTLAVLTNPSEY
jgi:hypothetical protein